MMRVQMRRCLRLSLRMCLCLLMNKFGMGQYKRHVGWEDENLRKKKTKVGRSHVS